MALNKLKFNSLNVTPAASEAIRFNSGANGLETTSSFGGSLKKLSTTTASSSASISFTSGLTSTYKEYMFFFNNIHPSTAAVFTFNGSIDSGSNYNVTKTTSHFRAYHNEGGSDTALTYDTGSDLAQSTDFQNLGHAIKTDADASGAGYLHLFEPSSTTFTKHFVAQFTVLQNSDYNMNSYIAGYFNTTSAIDAMQFKMASGNIDSGTITMYGVS
jgi:hypothetical protein